MRVIDLEHIMEEWAPRWTAWERDNVGLQIGHRNQSIKRVLVCLDVTPKVVAEAIRKKVDVIVAHHPLLFRPPASLISSDRIGSMVLSLAEKGIAVYASHTNLDAAPGGVNSALAETLGLENVRSLIPQTGLYVKIVVFVPSSHGAKVMHAMADAGAGEIGNYSHCSFQVNGKGTFQGSKNTNPFIGKPGTLEEAEETRIEMILPKALLSRVLRAMDMAHPYEEVAYDIYPLSNESPQYGMGAIGDLASPTNLRAFLQRTKRVLRADRVRFSGNLKATIQKVAVCGGSGSEFLHNAVAAGADVFVTSDIRYHSFHDSEEAIALVDAGHWETEQVVLPRIAKRIVKRAKESGETISVLITNQKTNPIHSY